MRLTSPSILPAAQRIQPASSASSAAIPSSTNAKESWDDRLTVGLSGALPVIGGAMNLAYGGTVAALSQSWSLGSLALTGAAANFATIPLLASGNHIPALALMAVSGATMDYIHRNW
jgi:hypothetical protein